MAIKAPTSNDTELRELMNDVKNGKIQLPEFQRGWTWDDGRIRAILASLSQGYPMGAIMQLQYGNEDIKFKYRPIEGVVLNCNVVPEYLALDGQQRLTSMYRATVSKEPVETNTEKGKAIKRFYYLDINKCLDENEERLDAVMSVPEDRKIKTNFDRDILLDISERELEYRQEMFPINIIFDSNEREDWADGYKEYYNYDAEYMKKYKAFRKEIIDVIVSYKLPVISLDKSTPREAVCKVFENVNTGGVALTVFELVTAMFATYEFDLRNDWEKCRQVIWGEKEQLNTDVMYGVDETAFLTTITLYSSYCEKVQSGDDSRKGVSCKKKDVLNLNFESYKKNKSIVLEGYKLARVFLFTQHVFRKRDLPYTTQIIPLAAICAYIGKSSFDKPKTQDILSQWFWCGIMGEMYGGANETRYANDIEDVVAAIEGRETLQRTVNAASFSSTRLLSLQTRNSAAYKGIMALIYKAKCQDFMNGTTMDVVKSMDGSPDIHHIFPEGYCMKMSYDKVKWNSIINKTPILASTNRSIGGVAPSIYVGKIKKEAEIDDGTMRTRVESHLVDYDLLISDDFEEYFVNRARQLLVLIEQAMKKSISDRGSEETIKAFGCSLE
jgi:hypothetical protein